MQYLKVSKSTKLIDVINIVGQDHIEDLLHLNNLERVPNLGKSFIKICNDVIANTEPVMTERKISILNRLSADEEIFEIACLMNEDSWKVMSSMSTFPNYLIIPDDIVVPPITDVIGGNGNISDIVFRRAITQMLDSEEVDPSIFNELSDTQPATIADSPDSYYNTPFEAFNIPWGKITLYSSLSEISMDFPCYPEVSGDGRTATYTQMPDLLYQYEPWYIYENSGPRQVVYKFHFHRDMWNGDHTRGGANKLIRFCEANCYPRYNGSSVHTSTVALYIDGSCAIHGIITNVSPEWSGPIGHDGWYLECNLSITIIEIANKPLNYDSVMNLPIIG